MKKVLVIMLLVVFMGCSLTVEKDVDIEGSWSMSREGVYTSFEFGDVFTLTRAVAGVESSTVYDYYIDDKTVYLSQDGVYISFVKVVNMFDNVIVLRFYSGGKEIKLKREHVDKPGKSKNKNKDK